MRANMYSRSCHSAFLFREKKRQIRKQIELLPYMQKMKHLSYPPIGQFGISYQKYSNIGIEPKHTYRSPYIEAKTEYVRGTPTPKIIYGRIDNFDQCNNLYENKSAQKIVAERIFRDIDKRKPLTFKNAVNFLPSDTSPGYPLNMSFRNKKDAKVDALKWASAIRKALKHQTVHEVMQQVPPCYAAARRATQRQGADKSRLIWAYPMCLQIIEETFAQPLTEELRKTDLFGWSINYLNSDAAKIFNALSTVDINRPSVRFGLDWTNYDARVQSIAIRWAFSVLRGMLSLDKQKAKEFKLVEEYFLNTPLLYRRRMYRKSSGVPSGSCFTQIIDSLVNMYIHTDLILSVSKLDRSQHKYDDIFRYSNYLGDDSVVRLWFGLDRSQLAQMEQLALVNHNMILSVTKSWYIYHDSDLFRDHEDRISENTYIHYLGKTIMSPLDVVADYDKVVAAAKLPEKPDRGPDAALTRLIGLAWSSGTSRKIFTFLQAQYVRICEYYPGVRPAPFSASERRMLSQVTHDNVDLRFPTFNELVERYARGRV